MKYVITITFLAFFQSCTTSTAEKANVTSTEHYHTHSQEHYSSQDSNCTCKDFINPVFNYTSINYSKLTWDDSIKMLKYAKEHKLGKYKEINLSRLTKKMFLTEYNTYWPRIKNLIKYQEYYDSLQKLDNIDDYRFEYLNFTEVTTLLEKALVVVGQVTEVNNKITDSLPNLYHTMIKIKALEILNSNYVNINVGDNICGLQFSGYIDKKRDGKYLSWAGEQEFKIGKSYIFLLDRNMYEYNLFNSHNTSDIHAIGYDSLCDACAEIPFIEPFFEYNKDYLTIKHLFNYLKHNYEK